ncbi:rod shape-determining protein MreC [Desulfothermus sp.]
MKNLKTLMMWIVLLTLIYLGIFTWNIKTHMLDGISKQWGLNIVGIILLPGKWIQREVKDFWFDYIDLRRVREENKVLEKKNKKLELENISLKIKVREWERIRQFLKFNSLKKWKFVGARLLLYKHSDSEFLNCILIDVGAKQGIKENFPVIVPQGLVGRVLNTSMYFSTVLLISDTNSRIPVISSVHRIKGIAQGVGDEDKMEVKYVPITAELDVGEEFVTSGLGGIFPKGIPVGIVESIKNEPTSLFKKIVLKPCASFSKIEEVLVIEGPSIQVVGNSQTKSQKK